MSRGTFGVKATAGDYLRQLFSTTSHVTVEIVAAQALCGPLSRRSARASKLG